MATEQHCRDCVDLRRPGIGNVYCGGDRPDLPHAYGTNHPLRKIPADRGKTCPVFKLNPALSTK